MAAMPRRVSEPERYDAAVATADVLLPVAAIALRLMGDAGAQDLIYLAADERRADDIGRLLERLAPSLDVAVFPPWDCLPFDRTSPSCDAMGRRMAVIRRLGMVRERPRIVITSIDAALQRTPPALVAADLFRVDADGPIDVGALAAFAERTGYRASERVDEPGQIEFHGQTIEIFPPGARQPFRIDVEKGIVASIREFDPASQRGGEAVPRLDIGVASEVVFGAGVEACERTAGFEHRLPQLYRDDLPSLFDAMPAAVLFAAPGTEARRRAFLEQLDEAQRSSREQDVAAVHAPALWRRFYVDDAAWRDLLARHEERDIIGENFSPVPDFATAAKPAHAFGAMLQTSLKAGRTVVLAGVTRDLAAFDRFLDRHDLPRPAPVADWAGVQAAPRGRFFSFDCDLDEGIDDAAEAIVLVAAADVMGTRAHRETQRETAAQALLLPPAMRIGDTVIHEDHGIGILRGLDAVEIGGIVQDAVRLEYHGGDSVLTPVVDLDKLWRYGADDEAVSLDRLHTEAWTKRRIGVVKGVIETARHWVEVAAAQEAHSAPKLVAPRKAYEAFSARFPFPETPDQARAIKAVVTDLGSGRQMDRLVCGDVGFGKTEVALRAAAVALLCGKQVALVAPTTVLARQHLETCRRRFAGFDVEIAGLSRLDSSAEAKRVKKGLADGSIDLVVGTQAIAGAGVDFADLGLTIIDEEQKFGTKLKADLRARASAGHILTMTATPIPRTLQMAMVGIQAVSVIATPPVRRRPIRTVVAGFEAAAVRVALRREHARGGQSFVIVPRIEDIVSMRARLAEIVPELTVLVAHGDLPSEEADRAMVAFAQGDADILLATNIVESGLDVPRANTMLVWHANLFGLSQLHQLRGRVGRGRSQGVAYLLTNPNTVLGETARARLATLQSFDRLGSGFAISARDLDIRGAGDLVGDDQAGHMKLIGLGLYQSLLARAVRQAKGEILVDDTPPELRLSLTGRIPDSYVAEADLRIDLYARLSRCESVKEILAFAEEVEDRFGVPPEPVLDVLAVACVRAECRRLGVAVLTAGPRAVALSMRPAGLDAARALAERRSDMALKGSKLVWSQAEPGPDGLRRVEDLLAALSDAAVRTPVTA